MATSSRFDFSDTVRTLAAEHFDLVRAIAKGERSWDTAPWHDKNFCLAVAEYLKRQHSHEESTHKIAVLKEIFGGRK
jgi:hypothetical protein